MLAARTGAPAGWGVLATGGASVVALLTAAVFRAGTGVAVGVALLGAAYTVSLIAGDVGLDRASPVVAAVLLVVAELGYWSVDLRDAIAYEPGMLARRAAFIGFLALGALAVGAVLLAAVDLPGLDGTAVSVAGAVAAAGAFVLLWRAVARP